MTDSRTVQVTTGNLNNGHVYLRSIIDFFPEEVIGGRNRDAAAETQLLLSWGGGESVLTDIDGEKMIFRNRSLIAEFFETCQIAEGDLVEICRLSPLAYDIRKFETEHGSNEVEIIKSF